MVLLYSNIIIILWFTKTIIMSGDLNKSLTLSLLIILSYDSGNHYYSLFNSLSLTTTYKIPFSL